VNAHAIVDEVVDLFLTYGDGAYLGEPVSLSEHMLQTAHAAELDGAPPALVIASLLHDIGHLLHDLPHDSADHGIDTVHEEVGAAWLAQRFGPAVSEPVRLHVAAKRYLCATDPEYLAVLSPASVLSLNLQGGPFTPDEAATFAANPQGPAAVRLRRWDDIGKLANRRTPTLDHFRPALVELARVAEQ
jgi:[1-hydroxy-2-(trimethylamino)ethyl]phosphonate dioxygenase